MKILYSWWRGLVGLVALVAFALVLVWLFRTAGQEPATGQAVSPTGTPSFGRLTTPTAPVLSPAVVPTPTAPPPSQEVTPTVTLSPTQEVIPTVSPQGTEVSPDFPAPLPEGAIVFPVNDTGDNSTFKVVNYDPDGDALAEENVPSPMGNVRTSVVEFSLSPDRRFIALNVVESDEGVPIPYIVSVDGTEARHLRFSEEGAGRILAWIPGTDRLLVDGATVNMQGEDPLPLLGPLVYGGAASPDGRWLVLSSAGHSECPDTGQYCFYFVRQDGTEGKYAPVPDKAWGGITPYEITWSPDGKRIAYVDSFYEGWFQIRTVDAEGNDLQKLDPERMKCVSPDWSPDSTHLVYACAESGTDSYRYWERTTWISGIWLANVASGEVRQIVAAEGKAAWWPTWLPDGSGIVFVSNRGGANDLWFVRPDGTDLRQLTFEGQIAD